MLNFHAVLHNQAQEWHNQLVVWLGLPEQAAGEIDEAEEDAAEEQKHEDARSC